MAKYHDKNLIKRLDCIFSQYKELLDGLYEEEVNLEKEIFTLYKRDTSTLKTKEQYAMLAKYFFELGLKAQKG